MGVTEYSAYSRCLRVGFMAIAVKFLAAKSTFSAGNIKRYHHFVSHFKLLYRRAHFNNLADKFMPEG
jgi:hypothetical protein